VQPSARLELGHFQDICSEWSNVPGYLVKRETVLRQQIRDALSQFDANVLGNTVSGNLAGFSTPASRSDIPIGTP